MNGFPQNLISYTKSAALGIKELKNLSLSRLRKVFSLLGQREKITVAALLAIAMLSLAISGKNYYYQHTVPVAATGGNYSEGLLGQPTYINPLLAKSEPDLSITRLIFASLYKYDSSGQLVSALADGMPQISADQKQYTINLKRGLKWHNDKPLTADDVIFTIQLLKDPAYKSPLRALWQTTSVVKLSDYSVRFTTKDISGPFLDNLTLPILPKSVWQNVDAQNFLLSKYNLEAIGSGPYAIAEIKKLPNGRVEEIRLKAFQNYYSGAAKIGQVSFKFYDSEDDMLNAFHSREILGLGFTPLGSSLYLDKNQNNGNLLKVSLPQYQIVFFNLNDKILNDLAVRQALALATDRQKIINDVFKGNATPPVSPLLFNSPLNPKLNHAPDINQAKALLDKAGWTLDPKSGLRSKKDQPLEISLTTSDNPVNSGAATVLTSQWQQLGINVKLTVLPGKQLMDNIIKPRNFSALLFPQKFGADPDPFPFWHSSQIKDPGFNLTGFADAAADKLIIDARASTDRQQRAEAYRNFNEIVMAKLPVIFLDQTEYVYVLDKTVKNVSLSGLYEPYQRFGQIERWYINEKRVWK